MRRVQIKQREVQSGNGYTSKGNQLKWTQEGMWYKADGFGYESLAEMMVSHMLAASTITDFVHYEPVDILYKEKHYRGCCSYNFRAEQEEIVTLEHLSRQYTGFGLAKELARISDVRQRILYTVEMVENITGLEHFGEYLSTMLELDAFFLNEDRHTNNIAVIYHTENKTYRTCPYFDMGLSLFSDTREEFPFELEFMECRKKITAKPFSRDFDEQLDAANELYGYFLHFQQPLKWYLKELEGLEEAYSPQELERVKEVLRYQAGKYQYMF